MDGPWDRGASSQPIAGASHPQHTPNAAHDKGRKSISAGQAPPKARRSGSKTSGWVRARPVQGKRQAGPGLASCRVSHERQVSQSVSQCVREVRGGQRSGDERGGRAGEQRSGWGEGGVPRPPEQRMKEWIRRLPTAAFGKWGGRFRQRNHWLFGGRGATYGANGTDVCTRGKHGVRLPLLLQTRGRGGEGKEEGAPCRSEAQAPRRAPPRPLVLVPCARTHAPHGTHDLPTRPLQ